MSSTVWFVAITEALGLAQCLFFGICVFAARKSNPANVILAAFMFAFAISYLAAFNDIVDLVPWLEHAFWPINFVLPPLVYLYVIRLTEPDGAIGRWQRHVVLL